MKLYPYDKKCKLRITASDTQKFPVLGAYIWMRRMITLNNRFGAIVVFGTNTNVWAQLRRSRQPNNSMTPQKITTQWLHRRSHLDDWARVGLTFHLSMQWRWRWRCVSVRVYAVRHVTLLFQPSIYSGRSDGPVASSMQAMILVCSCSFTSWLVHIPMPLPIGPHSQTLSWPHTTKLTHSKNHPPTHATQGVHDVPLRTHTYIGVGVTIREPIRLAVHDATPPGGKIQIWTDPSSSTLYIPPPPH